MEGSPRYGGNLALHVERIRSRLVVHFDGETEITNHAPHLWRWRAWGGQVPVYKDRIRRIEGQGLQAAQVMFSTAGNANFCAGMKEAEETQYFETACRSEMVAMLQRSPFHGMQGIQRNGIRFHIAQRQSEIDEIVILLSHPHNSARTY